MRKYSVNLSPQASDDIDALYRYIAEDVFAPATADKYIDGIYSVIRDLAWFAGTRAMSENEYLLSLYGADVRTVRYKKMTIVYNIIGNVVYACTLRSTSVRRVMASSLII